MKIAIHKREGSFSDKWIEYCKNNNISFVIVNAYSDNIINELEGCDAFMWHWIHYDYKAVIFAKQLTQALEIKGIKVFPNLKTCWHFDDKIGQKYLFELMDLPYINSHIFYDKKEALKWVNETKFPKVFKLRGGAGSSNVKLIKNSSQAVKKINLAFKNGFKSIDNKAYLNEKLYNLKREKNSINFLKVIKGIYLYFFPTRVNDLLPVQKGYVYFQDFIWDNEFDTRVTIIGNRCFAFRRFNRENDFRASGSGNIDFSPEKINIEAVRMAFKIAKELNIQSFACDFIYQKNMLKIIEISYSFAPLVCPGYWDNELNWQEGDFTPQYWMIEDLINSVNKNNENNKKQT